MLAINLMTTNKTPKISIDNNTLITIELAVQIPQKYNELNVEWNQIEAELKYKNSTTYTEIKLEIPSGSQTLSARHGYSRKNKKPLTIISYTTNQQILDLLTEIDTIEYSLSGELKVSSEELSILLKSRLIITDCNQEIALPWYPLKTCSIKHLDIQDDSINLGATLFSNKDKIEADTNNKNPYSSKIQSDNRYFIIENGYSNDNDSSNDDVVIDSNLLFSFKVINKGTQIGETYSLIKKIKPTLGVKFMVISNDGAADGTKVGELITSDNIGLFIFPGLEIIPSTDIVKNIIVRLVSAPIGTSLIENTIEIENNKVIIARSTSVKRINITSKDNNHIKTQYLESIAKEEAGLAQILSSEADKVRKIIALAKDIDSIVNTNNCMHDTIKEIIKYHILLEYKLDEALNLKI